MNRKGRPPKVTQSQVIAAVRKTRSYSAVADLLGITRSRVQQIANGKFTVRREVVAVQK